MTTSKDNLVPNDDECLNKMNTFNTTQHNPNLIIGNYFKYLLIIIILI